MLRIVHVVHTVASATAGSALHAAAPPKPAGILVVMKYSDRLRQHVFATRVRNTCARAESGQLQSGAARQSTLLAAAGMVMSGIGRPRLPGATRGGEGVQKTTVIISESGCGRRGPAVQRAPVLRQWAHCGWEAHFLPVLAR